MGKILYKKGFILYANDRKMVYNEDNANAALCTDN